MARFGIFLSAMTARPPSTFFSCALATDAAANRLRPVRKRLRAGSASLPPSETGTAVLRRRLYRIAPRRH